jgi:hypothetical protein
MAEDRSDVVVQEAYMEAGAYAATGRIGGRLELLAKRTRA